MDFQRWWVLKSKIFGQESTCLKEFFLKDSIDELGMILENEVVQKLKLEKNVFNKQLPPKLIFLNDFFFEKISSIFDIEN